VLEPIEEAAIFEPGEPLGRDRWTRAVATQALEAESVARGHRDVGVHAHAADARAALALENQEIVGVDAVAHAEHTLGAAGTRRDAARDRGGVE
jgi:hypothetical protein